MHKKSVWGIVAVLVILAAIGAVSYQTDTPKKILIPNTTKNFSEKAQSQETGKAEAQKAKQIKNGQVAARVNGEVITVEEIRQGYEDNPQIAEQVSFNEFYEKALDVFVNGKLLYQAAVKADVAKSPEYQKEFEVAKEDIARKVFLEQAVEKKVTPTAVQAFYNAEYVNKFEAGKEMSAKHILVEEEQIARDIIEKLNAGGNFDDLAKEYTKDNTVDLGYFTEDVMVAEFSDAAKALNVGEYTKEPVKTQFGYHVILLTDVRDSAPLPLSELEPQIKNILSQQAVAEIFDELYQKGSIEKYDLDGKKIVEPVEEK
ncbi:MAG: peptidyl-prolyl cis-trans isomerase [Alphaproteobacteria bacterium]|nr:peptidyl-prolyl cis-trans isomerase [Alphaproteobacteria bacterium]